MTSDSDGMELQAERNSQGNSIFSRRVRIASCGLVLVLALGYFGFMAFQSATVYYYTVAELKELGQTADGHMVRVSGKLVEGSFRRDPESTVARFKLTDGGTALPAIHDGVLPELFFNEHSEIILEGSYTNDGVFHSHNVIVKCPSKYVAG